MRRKGAPLCVRKGTDQCNINVSISTKLSSSSRENSIAAPVSMTLSYMILHSTPHLLLVITYIEYRLKHLYLSSPGDDVGRE